jgi:hypothetical protein
MVLETLVIIEFKKRGFVVLLMHNLVLKIVYLLPELLFVFARHQNQLGYIYMTDAPLFIFGSLMNLFVISNQLFYLLQGTIMLNYFFGGLHELHSVIKFVLIVFCK